MDLAEIKRRHEAIMVSINHLNYALARAEINEDRNLIEHLQAESTKLREAAEELRQQFEQEVTWVKKEGPRQD
jgi:hypothetical protein